jgi:hypothetical protein
VVEDAEEMVIIADLGVAGGVLSVWSFVRDFFEHAFDEHVDSGVCFDELLEFFHDWVQGVFFFVDVLDDIAEPFTVCSVVWVHPFTDPDLMVSFVSFEM